MLSSTNLIFPKNSCYSRGISSVLVPIFNLVAALCDQGLFIQNDWKLKVLTCLMSLLEFKAIKRALYFVVVGKLERCALSMVVIDLRVFLDLQVSVVS